MKFQYVECGADSPKTALAFGYEFVLNGDAVEVTDPRAIEKLSNNASFRPVYEFLPPDDADKSAEIEIEKPKKRGKGKSDV